MEEIRSGDDSPRNGLFPVAISPSFARRAGALRGHVGNRAENRSFPGDPLGGNLGTVLSREFGSQLRQAEVENLDPALRGDHHIAGLQIPVNDSLRMRCRQGIRDGDTQFEDSLGG